LNNVETLDGIIEVLPTAITQKELIGIADTFQNNLYSSLALTIAYSARQVLLKTTSRNIAIDIYKLAIILEKQWRGKYPEEYIMLALPNPLSIENFSTSTPVEVYSKYVQYKIANISDREYLGTPYWRIARNRALARSAHSCDKCETSDNLNVYHLDWKYIKDDNYHIDNLVVMCDKCHKLWHVIDDIPKKKNLTPQNTKRTI
jgi:hypothetical protein